MLPLCRASNTSCQVTLQSQALPVFQDRKVPQTYREAFTVWKWFTQLLTVLLNDSGARMDMPKTCQSLKKVFSEQTMHSRTAEASAKHKSLDHFNYKRTRMVTFFMLLTLRRPLLYFALACVYLRKCFGSLYPNQMAVYNE